ncbi:MAG: dihydrofolate reductase [Polyangiaceae bacterium]
MAPLALIVAVSRNGVIGKSGALPWHIPEDLKHFRRVTTGHAIIMGRATHASIGKALPNRRNIVVSRSPSFVAEGCEVAHGIDEAIALARQTDPEPVIIGGAAVYEEALPLATRMYLTELARDVDGDVRFPDFDRRAWREVSRTPGETADVSFVVLERVI